MKSYKYNNLARKGLAEKADRRDREARTRRMRLTGEKVTHDTNRREGNS